MSNENSKLDNDEFPLDAFTKVYTWIGNWAEMESNLELRAIANAATVSLTAVGEVMLETMRHMRAKTNA